MERGLLLYFPSFYFLSSKESMSESGSVALLRRDFLFFSVNKRRTEEKNIRT